MIVEKPLISIIIPTFKSAKTIDLCLRSLMNQTYPMIEVLLIDNYSEDETSCIATKLGANFILFKGWMSSARNHGAKRSIGKYVLHVDSDMELMPNVIEECVDKCENENLDALIIPEISVGEGYLAKCKAIEKFILIGEKGYESARFIRRTSFELIKGFDENLEAGEDYDFHHRLIKGGMRISRINSFIKHHEGKLTFMKIISKYKRYGRTINLYVIKNQDQIRNRASLPHLYIKNWRFLLKNFYFLPGLITMHAVGYIYAGRYSRIDMKVCV
jgi:glycosyltransferase involved in cell wall biosynthesis